MGKFLTTEEFIKKAKEVHGEKYDYSKVKYINSKTPIIIICPKHGEIKQLPTLHLSGRGCKKCSFENRSKKQAYTLEEFKKKASLKHKNKYDYSLVDFYKNNKQYIKIICPKHGIFEQRIDKHLQGQGCPFCAGKYITTEEFIRRAKEVHGEKYDYSLTVYQGTYNKVDIICKKHGVFKQVAHDHLSGYGCPLCGQEKLREKYINKPAILYLIYLYDFSLYKVGVTLAKYGIEKRFRREIKNKNLKYKVIKEVFFIEWGQAMLLENKILKHCRKAINRNILFGGNNELILPNKGETNEEFIYRISSIIDTFTRETIKCF